MKGAPPVSAAGRAWRSAGVGGRGLCTFAAVGAVVGAARELREQGTYGYLAGTAEGVKAVREAFG